MEAAAQQQQQQQQQQAKQQQQEPLLPPRGRNAAPTAEWVRQLEAAMLAASWEGPAALAATALPAATLSAILKAATALLDKEPTLLELPRERLAGARVTVVGDTHGQYHDVARLFELHGRPGDGGDGEQGGGDNNSNSSAAAAAPTCYLFNGDYVDRGAWGVETLALLAAWKWAAPQRMFMLRGNHETLDCVSRYGFKAELAAKYGGAAPGLFADVRKLFAALPLAALVGGGSGGAGGGADGGGAASSAAGGATLVLHGGLFRAPPPRAAGNAGGGTGGGGGRRKSGGGPAPRTLSDVAAPLALGALADLRAAGKGGPDPDPERTLAQLVASDVMWSDPVPRPTGGVPEDNAGRGVGTVFGPDVTEAFLRGNGVRLIIRSHEGPDARDKRGAGDRMPSVDGGWSVDHDTPAGRLATLFSAPDYPQFGEPRYHNRGAVAHLDAATGYVAPLVQAFDAVLPRPAAASYYEVAAAGEEASSSSDDDDDDDKSGVEEEGKAGGAARLLPTPFAAHKVAAAAAAAEQQSSNEGGAAAGGASIDKGGGKSPEHKRSRSK